MSPEKGLESESEYYSAISDIQILDTYIDKLYNALSKTVLEDDILEIQDLIEKCKRKRLGLYGLTQQYQKENSEDNNIEKYRVRKGDTLAIISQIYYGNSEYWQYIYYVNELTTPILTPNQELLIPELGRLPKVFNAILIELYEQDRINRGLD